VIVDDANDRVLRERAKRLAQQREDSARVGELEVIVFRLGAERYALNVEELRGVHPIDGLTRVPCTPAIVAGILNLRGEIITVLDAASLLGDESTRDPGTGRKILTVDGDGQRVGLLVDEILAMEKIDTDRLDSATSARDFILGIAQARIALLDVQRLLSSQTFGNSAEIA
jgi:purine-binding chemotaxis protein CheW